MEINERIRCKADELFRTYGVKSITMDEIASQLGISKKTIYQSFTDKDQLVGEVIHGIINDNKNACMACFSTSDNAIQEVFLTMQTLKKLFSGLNPAFVYDVERGYPALFKQFQDYKFSFIYEFLKNNIERGKMEELYRQELNVEMIARFRLETMMMPFKEEIFPRNKFSLLQLHQELIKFYLYGMATPKGYNLIAKYQLESEKKSDHEK